MYIACLERGGAFANLALDPGAGRGATPFTEHTFFAHPPNELPEAPFDLALHPAFGERAARRLHASMTVEGVDEDLDPLASGGADENDVRLAIEPGGRDPGAVGTRRAR